MSLLSSPFTKVTFSCTACPARQKIPLRRVHFFETFHGLEHGEPTLILCPACGQGLQCPSPYRSHTGYQVSVDPENPPDNAFVHAS